MAQNIELLRLAPGEYAATIAEGGVVTEHRVTRVAPLQDQLGLLDQDADEIVLAAVRVLLAELPVTSLPHDIDLLKPPMDRARFDSELAALLT